MRSRPRRNNIGGALGRLWNLACSSAGVRRVGAMLVDALIVVEAFLVALLLRFDGSVQEEFWNSFWPFATLSVLIFVTFLFESGVYRHVLRYTGVYQGLRVASATAVATGVLLIANLGVEQVWQRLVPLSVLFMGAVLAFVQLVTSWCSSCGDTGDAALEDITRYEIISDIYRASYSGLR